MLTHRWSWGSCRLCIRRPRLSKAVRPIRVFRLGRMVGVSWRLTKAVGTTRVLRMGWMLWMLGMLGMHWVEGSIGSRRRWWSVNHGRQRGGRMRFSGNRCSHRPPCLGHPRRGDDGDVGDIRHICCVGNIRCFLNHHSRTDHRGCAYYHRRRSAYRSWNDDPSARTRRGWNKDPIGPYWSIPDVARPRLTHWDVDIWRGRRVTSR